MMLSFWRIKAFYRGARLEECPVVIYVFFATKTQRAKEKKITFLVFMVLCGTPCLRGE